MPQPWDPGVQEHLGYTRGSRFRNNETEEAEISTQVPHCRNLFSRRSQGWLRLPGKYPWWVFNNARTHRPKSCLAGRPQQKVHSRDGAEVFLPDLSLGLLSCQGQEDQCLLGRLRMRTGTSCRSRSISL